MEYKHPKIISGSKIFDDRGSVLFVNDFTFENVKRFYVVSNHQPNFIRAWHGHRKEGKYIYVMSGAAKIGVIPLEATCAIKPEIFILSEEQPKVLRIPPNYLHGFMTLKHDTKVMFFSTATLEQSMDDDIRLPYDTWNIWNQFDYR